MSQLTIDQAMAIAVQHHQAGRLPEAEQVYRQILAAQPQHAEALNLMGVLAGQAGQPGAGVTLVQRAIAIQPNAGDFHCNLGKLLLDSGHREEAIASFRTAITLGGTDPASAHLNLGTALMQASRFDEAADAFYAALQHHPDDADAFNNLGDVRKNRGEIAAAVECYRKAISADPQSALAHSNLVYVLHFHPDYDASRLLAEHRQWNARHAEPLKRFRAPHLNDRSPNRRLRIGYVSPDLRDHVVGRFLLPLLTHHDGVAAQVFCYSDVIAPDTVTVKIQAQSDCWRPIAGRSDEQVAELIRQDGIDILVDLTMHMGGNRMRLFARRPAPVQVTYLAYCSTTGLDAIDYRISDPHLDPEGINETAAYCEKTVRLPETYWCYWPAAGTPVEGELPSAESGRITFGCLNNFCKVSDAALAVWGDILSEVPNSRLILHAAPGNHRTRVFDALAAEGIDRNRCEFIGYLPLADYLSQYQQIDIALDPFPYAGGTTTCDALWMGVPVVTLAGRTAVGRGGVSILSNVGLPELIAQSTVEYIGITTNLAKDPARLQQLRGSLRERLRLSPVMNAPCFARHMEAAYRAMWRRWCVQT